MKFHQALALALACTLPFAAYAQWQWLDNSGNKVFSDRAPPLDIPAKNILKQPGGVPKPRPLVAPDAAAPASAAASAPKISGTDKALEEKKKQTEDAEAAKRKAESDKIATTKADNCVRAKQAKANYESGMRVARVNDKGEREILDDDARAAEVKRAQDSISADCK